MKKQFLYFAFGLLLSPLCWAQNSVEQFSWHWQQKVKFASTFDPNGIALENGERLDVQYGKISWENTTDWPKGKTLILGYNPTQGTYLEDPTTQKRIGILGGLKTQPIDARLKQCTDQFYSTYGMSQCLTQATAQWDRTLNRNYQRLMKSLTPKQQNVVKKAQRQWLAFRDAQIAAIQSIYDRQGTIWGLIAGQQILDLTKTQALRLNQYQTF